MSYQTPPPPPGNPAGFPPPAPAAPMAPSGAAPLGWALVAIAVVSIIVEFMTANSIIDSVNEQSGYALDMSAGDFVSAGSFASVAFAILLAVLVVVGDKGNLGARKGAGVLAVLTALGGLIGIFGVMSTSSDASDIETMIGVDVLPGYYVPVALILCIAQLALAGFAAVKLLKK